MNLYWNKNYPETIFALHRNYLYVLHPPTVFFDEDWRWGDTVWGTSKDLLKHQQFIFIGRI